MRSGYGYTGSENRNAQNFALNYLLCQRAIRK